VCASAIYEIEDSQYLESLSDLATESAHDAQDEADRKERLSHYEKAMKRFELCKQVEERLTAKPPSTIKMLNTINETQIRIIFNDRSVSNIHTSAMLQKLMNDPELRGLRNILAIDLQLAEQADAFLKP
jgi:hypothetical protein